MRRSRRRAQPWLAALLLAGAPARAEPPAPRPFHVIAHRGASAHAPENTLPAFARALELGAPEVELDVQLSRDGVPVLFHDRTLDAKTPLRGRVREHLAAELRSADIGRWFDRTHPGAQRSFAGTPLATLAEVFEAFGPRLGYHVELKDEEPDSPAAVLRAVTAFGLEQRVMVTSFSRAQLDRIRRGTPRLPTCWLLERASHQDVDAAASAGDAMVGVRAAELTPELVRHAHARGLQIRAFGVDDDALMERALRSGCDGMTVDWPERLLARLRAA